MPQTIRIPVQALQVVDPPPAAVAPAPMRVPVHELEPDGPHPWTDEEWAAMPAQEKLRNLLQWGGRMIGGAFLGPAGADAADHPGATLAAAALPTGLGFVASHGGPPLQTAARAALGAMEKPAVGGAVGAVEGYRHGGVTGAIAGGVMGAVNGPLAARALRRALPTPRVSRVNPAAVANAAASERMVEGMGAAARPLPAHVEAPATTVAASAAPVASTPAPPTAATAPTIPPSAPISTLGPRWSPQRVRNEVGLAARRSGHTLSEEQLAAADHLVMQGRPAAEAVQAVATPNTAPAPVAAPAKFRVNAAEQKVYAQLRRQGKSHQEAATVIELQRALAAQLGTPSSEAVRTTVSERNATGRWPGSDK